MQSFTPLNDVGTLEIQHHTDVQCVRHLHSEAEAVLVTGGTLRVTCNHREVVLHAGEALYMMPFEMHSYITDERSHCTILVFSADLVPDFAAATGNAQPAKPVFHPSETVLKRCTSSFAADDVLHRRAILYPLCCDIVDQCHFSNENRAAEETVIRVERYIVENMTAPLTLKSVATAAGLNPSYLSRLFKQSKGIGFTDYVNIMRCSHAARLLISPGAAGLSVTEIAYQCGFDSIRTFNRLFRQHYRCTPSAMRKSDPISLPKAKKRPPDV